MGAEKDVFGLLKSAMPLRLPFNSTEKPAVSESDGSPACGSPSPLRNRRWSPLVQGTDWDCDVDHENAFAAMDYLEKGGLVNEAVLEQTSATPSTDVKSLRKCSILMKDNERSFSMLSEIAEVLLTARYLAQEQRFEFYLGIEDFSDPSKCWKPSYVMDYNADVDEWILMQRSCKYCTQRPKQLTCESIGKGQQLARIQHTKRGIPPTGAVVHNLNIFLPPVVAEGRSSAIWCPMVTGRDLGVRSAPLSPSSAQDGGIPSLPGRSTSARSLYSRMSSSLPHEGDASELLAQDHDALELCSLLPKWDEMVKSFVLNFNGRSIICSPRNFMLMEKGAENSTVVFQHARTSETLFCLDFAFPFSNIQAFAVALSTLFWD
eukprot:TRINITY_DN74852_c0_g1_i1.p1 TRINITY_DN74852_c0_g1~~TRINITY_DN74852_c0_g1_i1.p1  ORF type:complete len:402 (+),score=66.76 TRINITY_DN74852_c0_g1_i1:80-1207(+)